MLYEQEPSQSSLDIVKVAADRGNEVITGRTGQVSSKISKDGSKFWINDKEISDLDICFLRSFGKCTTEQLTRRISLLEHMEIAGIKVINSTYSFRSAQDLYSTQYKLQSFGLPIVLTYTTENMTEAYHWSEEEDEFLYKPILDEDKKNAMRFNDADLAYNAYKMLNRSYTPFILQKYIPDTGEYFKILIIGDEAMDIGYQNYLQNSGIRVIPQNKVSADIPERYLELGRKASKAMHLDYSTVDILETTEGPIIINVDGAPEWQEFNRIYDINVAEKIMSYAESK